MRRIILLFAGVFFIGSCGVKGPPEPPIPSEGSLSKPAPAPAAPNSAIAPQGTLTPNTVPIGAPPPVKSKSKKKPTSKAGDKKGQ